MPISQLRAVPATAPLTTPVVERRKARSWWPDTPGPYLLLSVALAGVAYAAGIATGFASDDYGWLRHGVRGELGWETAIKLAGHTNALPLEISFYHLKFVLFGFNPIGYHLFSLAGHIINVVLIYALARRLGASIRVASLAAGLAAVLGSGVQAIYWMSGDPHVFAAMLALGALILYIDHRVRGAWWRYALSMFLATVAALVKAEGVAVIAGVVGYEFIYHQPPKFTWKILPFAITPLPFVWWEWTTTDQLSSHRGFGLSVIGSGFGYLRQLFWPLDPTAYLDSTGGILHRALNTGIGTALVVEGAALATLFCFGLARRSSWLLIVFGLAGTAPAIVVTLGTQSRYAYFAGLLACPVIAFGANRIFKIGWERFSHQAVLVLATLVLATIISFQTWITAIQSGALRAAHNESIALRSAVLADHPTVPDGTRICIVDSPLDTGTAIAVFADPRLSRNVGLPTVLKCATAAQAAPDEWIYQRLADGTYVQVG